MAVRRIIVAAAAALTAAISVSAQITIAPENRCSPYNRSDYSYPQSIELRIIAENLDGEIISPYTGEVFTSRSETDIEHIVATSEAHDSGLCAATVSTRRQFAQDLDNLTLASPSLHRHQKSGKDLAEWTPAENVCWFAQTVVSVKAKYKLSMDIREAEVAIRILHDCLSRGEYPLSSQPVPQSDPRSNPQAAARQTSGQTTQERQQQPAQPAQQAPAAQSALALYDDNGNGRITCKEARNHGIAPVSRGHPAYQYMYDGDNDGTVCE